MKNNLFRQAILLVAAVLLSTSFWSCSKDDDPNPDPEPTPTAIAVTGVTLNKTGITLEVDGSETLTATVVPDDATNKEVTWSSDKPEIVTVDATGKVTGVATGEATITVTTEDGGKTATCKVAVKVPDIEGVVWFDEELAKTDIPEAMVFKDGTLLYYQYAKNDKAVSILKKETGKETIKKGDLVQKYTYSYTIVKNADGTSGTILSTGITMEYSKLTMNSVLMVVNGKNTLQCYTAEYLGFPINGVLK